jgi:hypothetical protein
MVSQFWTGVQGLLLHITTLLCETAILCISISSL